MYEIKLKAPKAPHSSLGSCVDNLPAKSPRSFGKSEQIQLSKNITLLEDLAV